MLFIIICIEMYNIILLSLGMRGIQASLSNLQTSFYSELFLCIFYLVLPRENDFSEQDCFCPVIFEKESLETEDDCFNLENCSCLSYTRFKHSNLEVCRPFVFHFGDYTLSIQNLTKKMNNSRLHIFQGYFCDNDFFPTYRLYTHLFEILIGKV